MKTLVLGASPNPQRFSYKAVRSLVRHGFEVEAVGIKEGKIDGINIKTNRPVLADIHTITIYLKTEIQKEYYDYILKTNPKRLVFNPGTENFELMKIARDNNIEVVEACSLVMLNNGRF